MKTAFTTQELGLGLTIAPVDETASATSLAGLAWVNQYNLTSESLRLILKETSELKETPRVQPAAGFPMIDLNPIPDVRKVLKHDSSTCIHIPDNRSGNNVVAIPTETLFASSKASEMPFGRLRTFGLQVTSETKYLFDNFLHVFIAMKAVIGTNGWSGHSQIHANSLTVGNKLNIGQTNNNMKVEPTLAVNQVSCSGRATHRRLAYWGTLN